MPTSQNGQTHSNNSSAVADELFECVWPYVGLKLEGLSVPLVKDYEITMVLLLTTSYTIINLHELQSQHKFVFETRETKRFSETRFNEKCYLKNEEII